MRLQFFYKFKNRVIRTILLTSAVPLLGQGCASLRDNKQELPIACNTPSCQVTVDGEIYNAPAIISVDRARKQNIRYQYESQIKIQNLKSSVRWFESIGANIFLGVVNPALGVIGLIVDWTTGSMWDLDKPFVVHFKDVGSLVQAPQRIFVAPVNAETIFESEVAEAKIIELLKQKYPASEIIPSGVYENDFERSGWTYSSYPVKEWKVLDLYKKLNATFIVKAVSERKNEKLLKVEVFVHDIFRSQQVFSSDLEIAVHTQESRMLQKTKSAFVSLLPNAIAFQSSQVNSYGFAMQKQKPEDQLFDANTLSYSGESRSYSMGPQLGDLTKREEFGLSVSNLDPDMGRRFRYVARWATESAIRRSVMNVYSTTWAFSSGAFAESNGGASIGTTEHLGSIENYNLGFYIGPELGVEGALGYIYFNLLTGPELIYSRFSPIKTSMTDIISPTVVNFGYKVNISENTQIGLSLNSKSLPNHIASRFFSEFAKEKVSFPSVTEWRTIGEFIYYFPEGKSYLKKNVKKIVSKKE